MRTIKIFTGSIAFGAMAFLVGLLLAPAAEGQAARSRSSSSSASSSSSSSGGSSVSRASSSSSVSSRSRGSSGRGAAVTRSPGRVPPSGPRTVVSGTSTHRSPGYGRHGHGRYTGYPYYYGGHYPYYPYYPYWGLSYGLGWWGGYYYSPYYAYHYPHYSPYVRSYSRPHHATRVYEDPVGAFDLNVKPKKTEVWVDGRFVGTAGRFDGFPDYLWLDEGEHQLIFYLEGYVTVERQVETLPGVVADLRLDMEKGRSIPPRQIAEKPAPAPPSPGYQRPRVRVEERASGEQAGEAAGGETPAATAPATGAAGELDLRQAPGRLVLSVEPADASVYLDGRYLGTGRDLARLHAGLLIDSGSHRLEIVRPGYEDRAIEFSISAGEEERIEIGLESG